MALFERDILMPYLQNICAVEIEVRRLETMVEEIERAIEEWREYMAQTVEAAHLPQKPQESDFSVFKHCPRRCIGAMLCFGVCVLMMWGMSVEPDMEELGAFLLVAYGIWGVGLLLRAMFVAHEDKEEAENDYKRAMADYEEYNQSVKQYYEECEAAKQKFPEWENELKTLKGQLRDARALRRQLYGVNIIPNKYRSIHVAYYLYDYFSSSRENDLDKIIQTMLLDEIVQRLDRIIQQQSEIILNQRYQLALQEQQNEMIAANHREQMQQLARLERNQELQTEYLDMIEANTEASAYFAAAACLQNMEK